MTELALIALWCWCRNHPDATFPEFLSAVGRARRIGGGE